ncbi:hypothetical protein CHS0354_007098 [Potamilus streckersoni]|uniref:Fucosyltransferase n=1 Tax=Potamilus streckersoni TaxID=2493646 RepID=A0AAE0W9L8_9BIVA|nr:hypothetical protein CHS0354_007098 [Potamilus streckersoni]
MAYSIVIVIAVFLLHQTINRLFTEKSGSASRIDMPVEDKSQFITMWVMTSKRISSITENVGNVERKILYWTNLFGKPPEEYMKIEANCNCRYQCRHSTDHVDLKSSDAIIFHLYDIWAENWILNTTKIVPIPNYRHPSQVWVIVNMEPLGHLWGNLDILNGLFNWTMTYRGDSTHLMAYGKIHRLNAKESNEYHSEKKVNYFRQKHKSAVAMMSNCKDYARRYKLIKQVQKYLVLDLFGKCYGNLCGSNSNDPFDDKCHDILKQYRFYLAFENSFCKDYVTEKYWLSLKREQIPIVNWKHVNLSLVIPKSYINVYDFHDIDSFGKYIRLVNSNETLYNSYFEWKHKYTHTNECLSCIACKGLHEKTEVAQSYTNFAGWIKDDFCEEASESNVWLKNYDRDKFDQVENLSLF